jgi:outer membrane protein assembly factor BamB
VALGLAAAAVMLSACAEPEIILPGVRENIRSVLQDPGLDALPSDLPTPANTARAIALPAQQNNASWAQGVGTQSTRVAHAALRSVPQMAWSADIGEGNDRKHRITASPVVAGGAIFTLDAQARVTATSAGGGTIWSRDLTPASDRSGDSTGGGLSVAGDTLYVSVGFGVLAALDTATGATRWTQELLGSGSGTPTVSGDLVYLTSGDDTGWALRRSDGRVQWQTGTTASVQNVLGAPAPAVTDDLAIMAFGTGEVKGLFRQGGLERWTTSVVGKRPGRALSSISDITSAPVVSGGTVYAGNQSGRLEALNLGGGAREWIAREGVVGPVWPAGGSVFAITDLNELVRLDATDGTRIWGTPLPNFVKSRPRRQNTIFAHYGPILAGGRIILASGDGKLRSFDPVSGALVSAVDLPGGAASAPVVAGGTLYVVSRKGKLHAFR